MHGSNMKLKKSFRICLFRYSTCFDQTCARHQENQLYQYDIWHVTLCRWSSDMQVSMELVPDGHLHRVTYTKCRIVTILLMMSTWLLETCRESK